MGGMEGRGGEEKGGVRIFGVTICGVGLAEEPEGRVVVAGVGTEVMRKSKSMGNLASAGAAGATSESAPPERGYLSDDGLRSRKPGRRRRKAGTAAHERKKGTPWTEEEHRTFLEGLEKLGKGDWRGISRKFVLTRTPTQVASHAQKYFIRQNIPSNKKRRSSLFDVAIHEPVSTSRTLPMVSEDKAQKGYEDITLQPWDSMRVGGPDVNSAQPPPQDTERAPNSCSMMKWVDHYEPKKFSHMESMSELKEKNQMCIDPIVSRTLSLRLDASQSTVPWKVHANQSRLNREFNFLPCRPAQVNTLHQVAESSDLDLSIAPPTPHSLGEAPSHDGIGAIRVI